VAASASNYVKSKGKSNVHISLHGTKVFRKYNKVRIARSKTSNDSVWNDRNNIYNSEGTKCLGIMCTSVIESKYIQYMREKCITQRMVRRLKRTEYIRNSTGEKGYGNKKKPVIYSKQLSGNTQCTVRTHPCSVQVGTGASNIVKMYYVCKCAVTLSIYFGCKKSRNGEGCIILCKKGLKRSKCGEMCKKCMEARLSCKYVSRQNNKRNVWSKQYKNLSVLFEMSSVSDDKSLKVDTELKVVMDGVMEMDQAQQEAANGEYSSVLSGPVLLMCCRSLSHLCTNVVIYVRSPLPSRINSIPVLLYIAVFNICMLVLEQYLMHCNKLPSISVYGEWNNIPARLSRNKSIHVLLYIAVFNIHMLGLGPYLMHCNKLPSISVYGEWNTIPKNKRESINRLVTPTYVVIYPWYVVINPGYTYSVLVISRSRTPCNNTSATRLVNGCNCYSRYRE
jgi:hypothetical protein